MMKTDIFKYKGIFLKDYDLESLDVEQLHMDQLVKETDGYIITNIKYDKDSKSIIGEVKIKDTEEGKKILKLLNNSEKISTSTRFEE